MSIRVAQVFGIAGAAWLAGNIASLSMLTVPALSQSHAHDGVSSATLARQWLYMYDAGKTQNPPVALVTTASLGYLAWSCRAGTSLYRRMPKSAPLYGLAALLTIGIVPYTIVFMGGTNNSLCSKAAQAVDKGEGTAAEPEDEDRAVTELLKRWNNYNMFRSLLPLLSAVSALVATIA